MNKTLENKIIEASTTADESYFSSDLKHAYFDFQTCETSDPNTKFAWSMRVGIIIKDGAPIRFMDLYMGYLDENVGADSGNMPVPTDIAFSEAFEAFHKEEFAFFNQSMSDYKNVVNEYLEDCPELAFVTIKEPVTKTMDEMKAYLELWEQLFSELSEK